MIVGFMANFREPTEIAKVTSVFCQHFGINLIYLRPKDVKMKKNTVLGKMFISGNWEKVEVPLPKFIDIAPYCFKRKNKDIMDYLRQNTFLSDNRINRLTKELLQEKLKEDISFSDYVIPTHRLDTFQDVIIFTEKYSTVVLKPLNGIKGKGVYIVEKSGQNYKIGYKTISEILTKKDLGIFLKENITEKRYILQKYVSSRTLQGDPFDCRVHLEKNGEGEWESARNYIRIGIGQTVISNVNQGGGISDLLPFLKANFGEQAAEINEKINGLAETLPYKVEELRGTHIMTLGLDIGIDQNGDLYLFEVNDGPATFAVKAEAGFLRANYYKYLFKKVI